MFTRSVFIAIVVLSLLKMAEFHCLKSGLYSMGKRPKPHYFYVARNRQEKL